jgi:hypothetical protein
LDEECDMPVLINEFEVIADAPEPQRAQNDSPAPGAGATPPPPEAGELLAPLRLLESDYLRVWAH